MKLLKLIREKQAVLGCNDKKLIGIIAPNKFGVSKILSGERKISVRYLAPLCLFLDLSVIETLDLILKEQ